MQLVIEGLLLLYRKFALVHSTVMHWCMHLVNLVSINPISASCLVRQKNVENQEGFRVGRSTNWYKMATKLQKYYYKYNLKDSHLSVCKLSKDGSSGKLLGQINKEIHIMSSMHFKLWKQQLASHATKVCRRLNTSNEFVGKTAGRESVMILLTRM